MARGSRGWNMRVTANSLVQGYAGTHVTVQQRIAGAASVRENVT